jgi:hypothetical protein
MLERHEEKMRERKKRWIIERYEEKRKDRKKDERKI